MKKPIFFQLPWLKIVGIIAICTGLFSIGCRCCKPRGTVTKYGPPTALIQKSDLVEPR